MGRQTISGEKGCNPLKVFECKCHSQIRLTEGEFVSDKNGKQCFVYHLNGTYIMG